MTTYVSLAASVVSLAISLWLLVRLLREGQFASAASTRTPHEELSRDEMRKAAQQSARQATYDAVRQSAWGSITEEGTKPASATGWGSITEEGNKPWGSITELGD